MRSSTATREAVRQAARTHAPDWYVTALLAPRPVRDDLIALAAYAGDLARIPLVVSEPLMGHMRLEWWREAIEGAYAGAPSGSPLADELARVAERHAVPRELLLAPIEGRLRELDSEGIPGEAAFAAYLAETEGTAFRLAARVLAGSGVFEADKLLEAAGGAYGRARLALTLPRHLAHGRLPLPRCRVAENDPRGLSRPAAASALRALAGGLAREARQSLAIARQEIRAHGAILPALLPLALVEPYLRALERPGHDPASDLANISPLARVSRLWLASVMRRF